MNFIIMCEVSGGVMGHRVAPLCDTDGNIHMYATRDEAQAVVDDIMCRQRRRESTGATFRYWVEEADNA